MELKHDCRDIVVAHSGTHHSYMTAAAMGEIGRLDKYVTSFYYKQRSMLSVLLRIFPKFNELAKRRRCELIDDSRAISVPVHEAIEKGLNLTLFRNQSRDAMVYWRDRMFAKHVAQNHINKTTSLVIGYPNACLEILKKVRSQSGYAVVDLPIGHYRSAETILHEERDLHPQFADSITYSSFDQRYRDRVDEEFGTAQTILVPSDFVRNTLVEQGIAPGKIFKIPYGSWAIPIEKAEVQPSVENRPIRVIYFGQITQRKGIKYLLDSVKAVRKHGVRVECTMIGKLFGRGRWLSDYQGIFKYIPHIGRSELRAILISHDLFVFPTLFEGSAYVIPEALAHALPVITTAHSGAECLEEGKNGYFVPIRNTESIVKLLIDLANDRDRLNMLKYNALASSHSVTWKRYREKLIQWHRYQFPT